MHWMQVAIRPAKPFAFGLVGATPVFGLPGNPVSSMVSYEVLARPGPAPDGRPGRRRPAPPGACRRSSTTAAGAAPATGGPPSPGSRWTWAPTAAITCAAPAARAPTSCYAMALADGLAVVPADVRVAAGDVVPVLLLGP